MHFEVTDTTFGFFKFTLVWGVCSSVIYFVAVADSDSSSPQAKVAFIAWIAFWTLITLVTVQCPRGPHKTFNIFIQLVGGAFPILNIALYWDTGDFRDLLFVSHIFGFFVFTMYWLLYLCSRNQRIHPDNQEHV